jgi:hypothetical protein
MKIIPQAGAADRDLALVGGAEARPDEHAWHEIEDVFEIGAARLLNCFGSNDLRATRNAFDLLSGVIQTAEAVRDGLRGQWGAFDDHGR